MKRAVTRKFNPDTAAFDIVAIPTPLQARALSLLGLSPSSV